MANQYENPDIKPCTGTYTWVPSIPVDFGGFNPLRGFASLVINKGSFINYYVKTNNESNIGITLLSSTTSEGDLFSPIVNTTRPLSLNFKVKNANQNNLVLKKCSKDGIIAFNFQNNQERLSSIDIEYDLSFLISDKNLDNFNLNPLQKEALKNLRRNGLNSNLVSDLISGLNPEAILIVGVLPSGEEEIITKGIQITRIRFTDNETNLVTSNGSTTNSGPKFVKTNIKIKDEILNRDVFPRYSIIKFKLNDFITDQNTATFIIKKIRFYAADRVNLRFDENNQLPCKAIGYSINIQGTFFPSLSATSIITTGGGTLGGSSSVSASGVRPWPNTANTSNSTLHIKVFQPEFTTKSPGFAHSLNLQLQILTFPVAGPLAESQLPGVTNPLYGVIIGPYPFKKQMIFYGGYNNQSLNMAPTPLATIKELNGKLELLEGGQPTNQVRNIFKYDSGATFIEKNEGYYEIIRDKENDFSNLYTNQVGNKTTSGSYKGSLPRKTFLKAYENSRLLSRNSNKQISFSNNIYRTTPKVIDIITKSNPCFIFECNSDGGFSSNLFTQEGFLSASIQCFIKDTLGIFDNKILFHIYASRDDQKDPKSSLSRNNALKILNSDTNNSEISFERIDSSWGFENTLITGNISDTNQIITASRIINKSQNSFRIVEFSGEFKIYCAIYLISTLNDRYSAYDLTTVSSLDLPLITFDLRNNFILSMPIYYRKSFSNGGFLQATRDNGRKGLYTKEENGYYLTNKNKSNIESKPEFYNEKISSRNVENILVLSKDEEEFSKIKVKYQKGTSRKPFIDYVDFIITTENISNLKIPKGTFKLDVDLENIINSLEIKFELIAFNSENYLPYLKLCSSEFKKVNSGINTIEEKIDIPFSLPDISGEIILRLYYRNIRNDSEFTINGVRFLPDNLNIEYFNLSDVRTAGSVGLEFYEDLPLTPGSVLRGCEDFILKLDLPSAGFVIFDPLKGLDIRGALYSPTWSTDLPENLEVDFRGVLSLPTPRGSQPPKIFFRTGLSNDSLSIDSKRNQNGFIQTVYNTSTNTTDVAVKQIYSEGGDRLIQEEGISLTSDSGGQLKELSILNPTGARSDQLLISGVVGDDENTSVILDNSTYSSSFNQPSYNNNQLNIQDNPKKVGENILFNALDYRNDKTFMVYTTTEGDIFYLRTEKDTVVKNESGTKMDGNGDTYNGKVSLIFPGIWVNNESEIIFYTYASEQSVIVYKVINSGYISKVLDFNQLLGVSSASIDSITVCKNDIYPYGNKLNLVITTQGKIFLINCNYDQERVFIENIILVYGSLTESNAFNNALNAKIADSSIIKLKYSNNSFGFTTNISGSQRLGALDFDGIKIGIQFYDGTTIKEIVVSKNAEQEALIRTIGSVE